MFPNPSSLLLGCLFFFFFSVFCYFLFGFIHSLGRRSSGFLCLFLFLHLQWQIINVLLIVLISVATCWSSICGSFLVNWFFIALYFNSLHLHSTASSPSSSFSSCFSILFLCSHFNKRLCSHFEVPAIAHWSHSDLDPGYSRLQHVDNFSCGRRSFDEAPPRVSAMDGALFDRLIF